MYRLEARGLHRFFHTGDEEVQALRNVTLLVGPGEVVAVTGPSGSGKSTLMACVAGLDEPDGGSVVIGGETITRRPEPLRASIRARRVGLLFQSHNLVDHLTVAANVALAQRLAGGLNRPRSQALLVELGIDHRASALPGTLSGGETVRAGLAVALANDPAVVLADEPTGEVDAGNRSRIIDLLRARAERGAAVVIVTHDEAVAGATDRVLQLRDGAVVQ